MFVNDLENVLGWDDSLGFGLVAATSRLAHGFGRRLVHVHMLVYKVLHVEDGDRLLFHDKFLSPRVRVDKSILCILMLGCADKGRRRHKKLHSMLHANITDLVNCAVTRHYLL